MSAKFPIQLGMELIKKGSRKIRKVSVELGTSARIRNHLVGLTLIFLALGQILNEGGVQEFFTDFGFVGLLVFALLFLTTKDSHGVSIPQSRAAPNFVWRWTLCGLGLFGALSIQRWFIPGTVIAGGDISPPEGLAWIGKIFHTYGWTGSNLGVPVNNQVQLPWAALYWLIHEAGGSAGLAQRLWFSALVGAILVSAGTLARSLNFSPLTGVVVAVLYFFNPYTVSSIGDNSVFLVAMALVPALSAAIVSYGMSRLRLWQLGVVFIVAAPFAGYAYLNPPIALMVALTTCATPLLVWAKAGRQCAVVSLRGVVFGGALLVAVSAYWIVPSLASLGAAATGSLSSFSAWAFTETRSTLRNGFWLNTQWAWPFSTSFPYAQDYSHFPLNLVLATVPLNAFLVLGIRRLRVWSSGSAEKLVGLLAVLTLFVVLLSNGTRWPGNLIFDPLYHLKYGWLLREPGRFLMAAALGFAILSGFYVQHFRGHEVRWPSSRRYFGARLTNPSISVVVSIVFIVEALLAAFPLWTGRQILGPVESFPSEHVAFPSYWTTTAQYLNSPQAPSGSLMVLPPDDFYQMPYNWYYGSDGFISYMMDRNVIDPSAQGYGAVSSELLSAVKIETSSILNRKWREAQQILDAVGTSIILVRGDINSEFPGRNISSPSKLLNDLNDDPYMKPIYDNGLLHLFALRSVFGGRIRNYATVNSMTPSLGELAAVPEGTGLVSSKPIKGHLSIFQLPSLTRWIEGTSSLSTMMEVPNSWAYSIRTPTSKQVKEASLTRRDIKHRRYKELTVSLNVGPNLFLNGDFSKGTWGPIGNCNSAVPVTKMDTFNGVRRLGAGPNHSDALELSASVDSACEAHTLPWRKGRVYLQFYQRSLSGAPARICILQEPSGICIGTKNIEMTHKWRRVTDIVQPVKGTKSLQLFLYADALGNGTVSQVEYAKISEHEISLDGRPFLVGTPAKIAKGGLLLLPTGFSTDWMGPKNLTHVEVDGLRNGWLYSSPTKFAGEFRNSLTSKEWEKEMALAIGGLIVACLIVLMEKKCARKITDESYKRV